MTHTDSHRMVKMLVVPVSIAGFDDQGEPVVFEDEDQRRIAEEAAVVGCMDCDAGISEAAATKCTAVHS